MKQPMSSEAQQNLLDFIADNRVENVLRGVKNVSIEEDLVDAVIKMTIVNTLQQCGCVLDSNKEQQAMNELEQLFLKGKY